MRHPVRQRNSHIEALAAIIASDDPNPFALLNCEGQSGMPIVFLQYDANWNFFSIQKAAKPIARKQ
jgi:hypothetical protein